MMWGFYRIPAKIGYLQKKIWLLFLLVTSILYLISSTNFSFHSLFSYLFLFMRLAPPSNKLMKKVSWDWLYKPEMDPEPELKKQDSALKHRQEVAESNLNIDANFTNRFAKLRDLLATTKTEDIESQQSFCVTERESGVYRKFKHYQKVAYLLLNQPKSSWMGRFLFGSIMGGIFFTVGEAIFMNPKKALDPPLVFSFLDSFVLCVFLLEFILRILSSSAFGGQISAVLFRPLVFIDVLVIAPLFIEILSTQNQAEKLIENLQLLSLLKTLAVFKLLRYVKNASLFWRGVSKSLASLFFLFIVIIMSTFIFAILVYYVEKGNPDSKLRQGIPTAFWWAIVTLTTVGYGDIVPVTVAGKVMGGLAGVFGMLLLALPVVILGYHFEEVFNERQDEKIIAKVKENELKGQKDLNHDLKEAYFVKRRIDSIEGSNQKVMSLLGNSGKIYKDVSRDLKALYKSIYGGAAMIKVDESCKSFGGQIKMLEKLQKGKKKIKLGQVFKKGITRLGSLTSLEFQSPQSGKPLTQDKTEELGSEALTDLDQPLQRRRSSQSPHKTVKKKPSDHPEDVKWDTTETVSKMPSLMSRPSLISRGKQNSLRSDFFKRTRANTLTPKIIIDQRGTEDTTPMTRTPTQYMISSETPNHWNRRSMFENPPIVYAQFGSDEDAGYRSISSLKSFSRKEEFDDRRRSTLHVANYYNTLQKNRGSFTFDRGETIKSNYLEPKQQNLKRWSWMELNSLEQFEEGDSKGSSVIIDIPLKAFKGYLA